jgi:sugar diacid utilization regulator
MTKEERKEYMKQYSQKNKEKFREYNTNFKINNPEKINQYNKKYWRKKYGEFVPKTKEHRQEYMRDYMKAYNEKYPHIQRSKRLLNDVLRRFNKSKTDSTSKMLGYTALQLKEHLDSLGMDWKNHQIDHKIPVSLFREDTPINLINDLRNLQPLTKQENLEKSNNYCTLVDKEYLKLIINYLI